MATKTKPQTFGVWIKKASRQLKDAGIETARLDSLILLEDITGKNRASILAHLEDSLSTGQTEKLNKQIIQRADHKPLAYIRGKTQFYGRQFEVGNDVLVPRPETEIMIDLLKNLGLKSALRIADIGTGSGCIGITAVLELPKMHMDFYDIDPLALSIARRNSLLHNVKGQYYQSDLFEYYAGPYSIILANLPYVPEKLPINRAATFEPKTALFAGPDGLEVYKAFWRQIRILPSVPTYILTEAFSFQHHTLARLAREANYNLLTASGLIQVFVRI